MKKLGTLCLVILAALGLTGVGYGAWSDTLNIDATAMTGTFDVHFGQTATNDSGSAVDPSGAGSWTLDGNTLTWTGPVTTAHKAKTEVGFSALNLSLSVADAYVGYISSAGCTLVNAGSIPVKVEDVTYHVSAPATGNASDVSVSFSGALTEGATINPGQQAEGAVYIAWNAVPPLSATYSLTVSITVSQWNAVN